MYEKMYKCDIMMKKSYTLFIRIPNFSRSANILKMLSGFEPKSGSFFIRNLAQDLY